MANRTVEVKLRLVTDAYKREAEAAARATEGLDDKVSATDRDLKKIPRSAAEAAAAMKLLGGEADRAHLKLDDLGKSSTSLGTLEQKLASARAEVRKLGEEFNRTGNSSTLTKLFAADDQVKELEKLKKRLVSVLGDAGQSGGKSFWAGLMSSASEGIGSVGAPVLVGAIIAAVLATPLIGAAINGALVAGIGAGGIAVAIVGQIHDPQVRAALADLGHHFTAALHTATAGERIPLLGAIDALDAAFQRLLARLDFKTIAAEIGPLSRGIAGFVDELGPGLNEAIAASKPALIELARDLPIIASSITDFFHELAGSSGGAVMGLRTVLMLLVGFIEILGHGIGALSNIYSWFVHVTDAVSGFAAKLIFVIGPAALLAGAVHDMTQNVLDTKPPVEQLGKSLTATGQAAQLTAADMQALSGKIGQTAVTADTLAAAMTQRLFNSLMGVDQATLQWHQSLTSLHDTLAKNGTEIDRHTHQLDLNAKKGQENYAAILAVVTANMQSYQAFVAAGGSAKDAAAAYDQNTVALEKQLRQAGYTQAQIDGLIGKYKSVPDTVNTTIAIEGLTEAINDLIDLERYLHGLPSVKYIDIITRQTMISNINKNMGHPNRWGGVYTHAAQGALRQADVYSATSPARYAFAEPATGGEAFIPRFGDSARSASILARAAGWYGMDVVPRGVDYAGMRSAPGGAGRSGPSTLQLAATFVLPSGEVAHKQLITYALSTNRTPAQLFPASSR